MQNELKSRQSFGIYNKINASADLKAPDRATRDRAQATLVSMLRNTFVQTGLVLFVGRSGFMIPALQLVTIIIGGLLTIGLFLLALLQWQHVEEKNRTNRFLETLDGWLTILGWGWFVFLIYVYVYLCVEAAQNL